MEKEKVEKYSFRVRYLCQAYVCCKIGSRLIVQAPHLIDGETEAQEEGLT